MWREKRFRFLWSQNEDQPQENLDLKAKKKISLTEVRIQDLIFDEILLFLKVLSNRKLQILTGVFLITYSMNFFKCSFPFNDFTYSVLIKGGEVWCFCDRFKLFSLNAFENSFSELIADRKDFDDRDSSEVSRAIAVRTANCSWNLTVVVESDFWIFFL